MMKKLIKNILKEYNEKHVWNNNNLIHNIKPNTKTLREIWDDIEVGKIYKIYGIYTANFIDWALEDQRVEVMDKDHRLLTVKVLDKIQMGAGQFRPGSRMFLTIGDDGDRVYITPVNDMVESDDGLDWIKEVPEAKWDDNWEPEDLVNKNFKIKTNGNEWRIVGENPTNKNTLIVKDLSSWQERELHFNTLRNWVKTGDVVFFELSENTVNENSEWGWVEYIEKPTLEFYVKNGFLQKGVRYNLTGRFLVELTSRHINYPGIISKEMESRVLPENGINVEWVGPKGVVKTNYVTFMCLDDVGTYDKYQLINIYQESFKNIIIEDVDILNKVDITENKQKY